MQFRARLTAAGRRSPFKNPLALFLVVIACLSWPTRSEAQLPLPHINLPHPKLPELPSFQRKAKIAFLEGFAAGGLLGSTLTPYNSVRPQDRSLRHVRVGLTYGLASGTILAALTRAHDHSFAERTPFGAQTGGDYDHSFWRDRWNTPLFVGIAGVHVLDYTSTRYFRNRGFNEWLLTNDLVDHRYVFAATEVGMASAGIGMMYLLHRSHHHLLERWLGMGWVGLGVTSGISNYRYPHTGHALWG